MIVTWPCPFTMLVQLARRDLPIPLPLPKFKTLGNVLGHLKGAELQMYEVLGCGSCISTSLALV